MNPEITPNLVPEPAPEPAPTPAAQPPVAATPTAPATVAPAAFNPGPFAPHYTEELDRCSPVPMNPDEHVLQVVYRHPINLLPVAVSTGLILVLVAMASYGTGRYADAIAKYLPLATVMIVLWSVGLLVLVILLIAYFIYRQNRVVLTTQNLMQVEQYGLFNRVVSKLSLANIEDVTGERKGLFATILNYGNLIVETAGEQENFVFEQAPYPAVLVQAINKAHEDVLQDRRTNREQRPE